MSAEDQERCADSATRRLRLLADQAEAVRAELSQMRADLAATKREFSNLRATRLAETSEMLVAAATHADTVAQSAVSSLDDLNLYSQLDELTGLPTRTLLLDRLETTIATAQRRGTRFGLVFLDLDGFKQINDTLGHAVGDQVLQIATQRLQSAVRESDTVSRHGGDEFIILFPEVGRAADLSPMAEKILEALGQPLHLVGDVLHLTASIGIAVFPEDGKDPATLLSCADAAMYRSKRRGHGNYEFHAAESSAAPGSLPAVTPVRRTDSVFAEHEANLRALRDANHQLLEAARNDQKMRAHAELAHQHQIDFVAMAAHAMRSPLTVIQMTAAMMKREPSASSSAAKRIATLEQQTKHLARLIDELLDGSRVGGGKFRLEPTQLSLDQVLDTAVEAARHALNAKNQTLHLTPPNEPRTMSGDATRINQLFENLLRNASRRAPEGGHVWFSVKIENAQALFIVADNGSFLSDEAAEKMFDLYAFDKNLPEGDSGLGIGLAVAKELTRAHGGTITARNSTAPSRAEFAVRLPCNPDIPV